MKWIRLFWIWHLWIDSSFPHLLESDSILATHIDYLDSSPSNWISKGSNRFSIKATASQYTYVFHSTFALILPSGFPSVYGFRCFFSFFNHRLSSLVDFFLIYLILHVLIHLNRILNEHKYFSRWIKWMGEFFVANEKSKTKQTEADKRVCLKAERKHKIEMNGLL